MIRFATLAVLIAALLATVVAALPVVAAFDGVLVDAITWVATVTAIADRFVDIAFLLSLVAITLTVEGSLLAWRLGKMIYELIARL